MGNVSPDQGIASEYFQSIGDAKVTLSVDYNSTECTPERRPTYTFDEDLTLDPDYKSDGDFHQFQPAGTSYHTYVRGDTVVRMRASRLSRWPIRLSSLGEVQHQRSGIA